MLIRYGDKRFDDHGGIDLIAMPRAVGQALLSGEIVSGGSTLTMQVARLLEDGPTGSWQGKLRQIRVALALERRLTKEQILSLYLDRAPFGGNLEGVRAAAYAWFGKPPGRLTTAEAALLVAIPQAPVSRRPDRFPEAAQAARDRVLARMQSAGVLTEDQVAAALTEPSPRVRREFPTLAAHLADRVRASDALATVHRTTLDGATFDRAAADVLSNDEALARARIARLVEALRERMTQMDTIELELSTQRRMELERPNPAPMEPPTGGRIVAVQGDQVWPWDGEWWRDELPFYLQEIDNRCGR